MRSLIGVAIAALLVSSAHAQQGAVRKDAAFTIPSFTLTGPVSTGVVCTPTSASSGMASAAPAGTVMFTCVVSPSGWIGAVSIVDAALAVSGLNGNLFNLVLVSAGVAQTYPAGSGSVLP